MNSLDRFSDFLDFIRGQESKVSISHEIHPCEGCEEDARCLEPHSKWECLALRRHMNSKEGVFDHRDRGRLMRENHCNGCEEVGCNEIEDKAECPYK